MLLIIKCATILKKLHLVDSDFHDFNTRAHHNIKQPRKGQSLAHLENHNKTYEYAKRFAEKKSNTYSEIQTHGAIRALFLQHPQKPRGKTPKPKTTKNKLPRLQTLESHNSILPPNQKPPTCKRISRPRRNRQHPTLHTNRISPLRTKQRRRIHSLQNKRQRRNQEASFRRLRLRMPKRRHTIL